jgi:nucleoside-diphosphate-sugar epimerase
MRAIVTGGTGFIGNRLVLYLVRNGWEVTCLVRRNLISRWEQIDCRTAQMDALDDASLRQSLSGNIDCVFHLAAALDRPGCTACQYLMANGGGTTAVLELAEACGARSFVHTSTQLVIGKPAEVPFSTNHPARPESPYALSKLAGEMACEMFRRSGRVATTSLRLTSVVGLGMPGSSVVPLFVGRALRSEDVAYHGTGARVQNLIHVDDVVRACALAAEHPGSGVLNAGGDSLSMRSLAELAVRSTPGSGSRAGASGLADPQEDYRWIPELCRTQAAIGYQPCRSMSTFLPEYVESIRNPAPLERWWTEP